MKVRSFCVGVWSVCKNIGWADVAFKSLDQQVESLGENIVIHSVVDKMYNPPIEQEQVIVRVIVYDDK